MKSHIVIVLLIGIFIAFTANLIVIVYQNIVGSITDRQIGDIAIIDQSPNALILKVNSSNKYYYVVSKITGLETIEIPYDK